MFEQVHAGVIFILIGLFASMASDKVRKMVLSCCPFLALIAMINTPIGTNISLRFLQDYSANYFYVDGLSWVFGMIFCVFGCIAGIFSCHNKSKTEAFSSMAYVGASIGVILAHDWISFLFFWELEAVTSLFLIWSDKRPTSRGAGLRYILMHTLSGNSILFGVVLKLTQGQYFVENLWAGPHDIAFYAILLGVLINVACVPFHGWLVEGYPAATLTGSVFMSSYTTKVAVYALLRLFAGNDALIILGILMAIYGATFAVMENDMIRLLSYHIVSQVGYMVAGAGMGSVMSMNGATAHAICDILFKSLLFMCCVSLTYATGIRKINQLGGMARKYPFVFGCFLVGAFSIAGLPFFNGFVSKMMTVAAAEHLHLSTVALLLEVASMGTFLSIVFKMVYFIFLAPSKNIAHEIRPIEMNMKIAMALGAVFCILLGTFPETTLYAFLPFGAVTYVPYTPMYIVNQLVMMFAGVIPFILFLPRMEPHTAITLDTDWVLRKPFKGLIVDLTCLFFGLCRSLGNAWGYLVSELMSVCHNPMPLLDATPHRVKKHYSPDNYRTSIADTIMIILTVLFICVFYFRVTL